MVKINYARKKFYDKYPWGMYNKTLTICNVWKIDSFNSKLMFLFSLIVLHKHSSLLQIPYITNPKCFIVQVHGPVACIIKIFWQL